MQTPLGQIVPHVSQLFWSVARLKQPPSQSDMPVVWQTHAVPSHMVPAGQRVQPEPHAFMSLATQAAPVVHWCWPPAHVPHWFMAHAPPGQAVAVVLHCPTLLQVEMVLVLAHIVASGMHTPLHTLPTHAWPVQRAGVPHVPVELQVSRAVVPEHCVAPGAHMPLQAPLTHA
jgi:hypothetical protein